MISPRSENPANTRKGKKEEKHIRERKRNIMKKLISLALALVMILSLSVNVFAADGETEATETKYTITAPNNGRTYKVYQIFTGDYHDSKLSNVKWGANGTGTVGNAVTDEEINALTAVNSKSDTEKLAVIERYVNLDSEPHGEVKNGGTLKVDPGYYLIKDEGPVGDGESYSLYIVKVANDITITPKVGKTESGKNVKDTNDTTGETSDWQDAADYDVGDDVPFQLWAKLPEDYDNYTNGYKLTFHDTLSAGLSFNNDIVVKIGETTLTKDTDYDVVTTGLTDGCTFEVKFANLKTVAAAKAGSTITVEYTAELLAGADSGTPGNPNASHVTYTNNPNEEQAGEGGKTPDETVVVFTYDVIVNKTDGTNPLTGAGFTLYKKNSSGEWVVVGDEVKGDALTTFTFAKLDEGKYKLEETTVPSGYNKAADVEFEIVSDLNGNELKALTVTPADDFNITLESGSIETDIVNKAGSTLPSTGGMGTTLFYILGSVMVLAAVVLLVTKKRMASAE